MGWCGLVQAASADTPRLDAALELQQTERLRTADHPQFLLRLQKLNDQASTLTADQRWYLHYLDAWQAAFDGNYAKADQLLQGVAAHSGNPALVAKSSALLMDDMVATGRYESAFAMADRLVTDLPNITDTLAHFQVTADLSQLYSSAGQYDLAVTYARRMEQTIPPGETLCKPRALQMTALFVNNKLRSDEPTLQQAVSLCVAGHQDVFTDTLWLIVADLQLREHQPKQALALLRRIAGGIDAHQYHEHRLEFQALLARTWWQLGDADNTQRAALAVLALASADDISESLRDAYNLLYLINRKRGDAATALGYYEQYVKQDKGYINDVSARALAYQVVQQRVLARKLEAEELGRQNNVLRLKQALDTKAMETGRLYIALLLVLLASLVFWLYRIKRSQLRFRELSRCDGLTGIFNRQHFMTEAERILQQLEKRPAPACLISIDLDHFKQVNDNHGHAVGDAVLRHAVTTCQLQLRPTDIFGRLGGEEFGILLHGCSRDQGIEIANRICMVIGNTPLKAFGQVVQLSVSVGLVSTDTSGYGLEQLCLQADAALYRAKHAGRNRVIAESAKADRTAEA
jgi:diguanylate cyclase (GGDEF)-like protein